MGASVNYGEVHYNVLDALFPNEDPSVHQLPKEKSITAAI